MNNEHLPCELSSDDIYCRGQEKRHFGNAWPCANRRVTLELMWVGGCLPCRTGDWETEGCGPPRRDTETRALGRDTEMCGPSYRNVRLRVLQGRGGETETCGSVMQHDGYSANDSARAPPRASERRSPRASAIDRDVARTVCGRRDKTHSL